MKKRVTVIIVLILTGIVFAQTLPPGWMLPSSEKFNFLHFVESAIPPKHIHPRISLYYWYYTGADLYDDDWDLQDINTTGSESRIMPVLSFGVGDVVEFGIAVPFVSNKVVEDITVVTTTDGSGVGDMLIWLKTTVIKNPWFGIRTTVKIPTGDDDPGGNALPTGTGQTDFDMGLVFSVMPEKVGFLCDVAISGRLRFEKEIDYFGTTLELNPGNEGRLQLYLGGMPVEGFGVMFGGDGVISMNDVYDYSGAIGSQDSTKSFRMNSMLGLRMFYQTPFGIRMDGGLKFDVAGHNTTSGLGFVLGATYEPQF